VKFLVDIDSCRDCGARYHCVFTDLGSSALCESVKLNEPFPVVPCKHATRRGRWLQLEDRPVQIAQECDMACLKSSKNDETVNEDPMGCTLDKGIQGTRKPDSALDDRSSSLLFGPAMIRGINSTKSLHYASVASSPCSALSQICVPSNFCFIWVSTATGFPVPKPKPSVPPYCPRPLSRYYRVVLHENDPDSSVKWKDPTNCLR
jgi:hypothetical protein